MAYVSDVRLIWLHYPLKAIGVIWRNTRYKTVTIGENNGLHHSATVSETTLTCFHTQTYLEDLLTSLVATRLPTYSYYANPNYSSVYLYHHNLEFLAIQYSGQVLQYNIHIIMRPWSHVSPTFFVQKRISTSNIQYHTLDKILPMLAQSTPSSKYPTHLQISYYTSIPMHLGLPYAVMEK